MPHQRTTGLPTQQFAALLAALETCLTWFQPNEKPRKLTLSQALKMTLMYHRHNITEELLADIFEVSQPTVSRTINLIEKALLNVLEPMVKPLKEALNTPGSLVVDGTLITTWNWRSEGKTNFSNKHKREGFNHQIICTLDGKLLAITDPIPGARHDAYCFRKHGLDQLLDSSTLADKGYIRLGLSTPTKKPIGEKLSLNRKVVNRQINKLRCVVERVIANVKTWRVLHSGFRRPLSAYARVFSSGAGVGVYGCWVPLMNKPHNLSG